MHFAFLQAPICAGSPTDGSQYAFEALIPSIQGIFGARARLVPMSPSAKALLSSPPTLRSVHEVMDIARGVYQNALFALKNGEFPIVIGGDHSLSIGSIAASSEIASKERFGVVWVDGHTDINTEKTSQTGCIHGMPLAQAMGLCTDALNVGNEKIHLLGAHTAIIGARSIDDGEYPIIESTGTHLVAAADLIGKDIKIATTRALSRIRAPRIHVSFDVDCMDGDVFPATGYRMPHGLTFSEAKTALFTLLESGNVMSLDLVEYNPLLDPDRCCLAMLEELLLGIYSRLA